MIKFQATGTFRSIQRKDDYPREGTVKDNQGNREFGKPGWRVKQMQMYLGIRSASCQSEEEGANHIYKLKNEKYNVFLWEFTFLLGKRRNKQEIIEWSLSKCTNKCLWTSTFGFLSLLSHHIHLRFLYGFVAHFFLALIKRAIVWMHHSLFIHSPIGGHLGCLQVLTSRNKPSINIYVQVIMWA